MGQTLNHHNVIIVGGGISGLAAAKELKEHNIDVLVLEAQDKVGGRLRTDRSLGVDFDEGASWIHGPKGNPITVLSDKAGIQTYLTPDTSLVVYDEEGNVYSNQLLDDQEDLYNGILEEIGGKKSLSVYEYIKAEYPKLLKDNLWMYMWSAFLEFDTGGDIKHLSAKYFYDDEEFKGEDRIVTNGYDKITDFLATDAPIELNTIVNGIDYSGKTIKVSTNASTYYADYVLVTVPLGVLKKEKIVFVPPLKKKTVRAVKHLQMGSVNKFLCVWDTAFWDVDKQYIGYTPKEKGKFNYFLNVKPFTNANALMTFSFGDYSLETEKMSDEEIIENIMSHLKVIYGDSIPYPKYMKRTSWNSNPYTYGSYSFVGISGRSKYYKHFKQSKSSHLYFAGEHTSKPYRGTVHGAYLSGLREAEKIIKAIQ